jgi:hypothetical protein
MLKKIIVLYLLISTVKILAQSSFTFSTNINITISNGPAINKVNGDLDFGEIIFDGSRMTLSKSPDLGVEFEVTGFRMRQVTISFPNRINLDNYNWVNNFGGIKETMRFTPIVNHTNGSISYIAPSNVRSGRSYRLSNDNPLGKLYLWLGGSLSVSKNQSYGSYNGTFTMTVAY